MRTTGRAAAGAGPTLGAPRRRTGRPQQASLRAVDTRSDPPTGSALTVGRFLALVVLLFGFIAMHGLAATNGDGTHHSPLAWPTLPGVHSILSTGPSTAAMPRDGFPDQGDADHGTAEDSRLALSLIHI